MLRRILVPLDGSPSADYALPFAIELARRFAGTIELVYVRPARPDGETEAEEDPAAARLTPLAARLHAGADVSASATVLRGDVVAELERHAADGTDLIVMTTHGRTGPSRAWLGSVVEALVRRVGAPLLLVRPLEDEPTATPSPALDHLLVPLDGSSFAERVLPLAKAVLEAGSDARATLLTSVSADHAASPSTGAAPYDAQQQRERAETYLETVLGRMTCPTGRRIVLSDNVPRAILHVAAEDDIDLIAMATHGRSGLSRLLLGSVADKVLRGTHKPVLLLRPGADSLAPGVDDARPPTSRPAS